METTWLEISYKQLRRNARALRGRLKDGVKFCGVIKANAYGHGAVEVGKVLLEEGADRLAIATLAEGRELREAGIDAKIHLLGSLHPADAKEAVENKLIPFVSSVEAAKAMDRCTSAESSTSYPVHVHVESGMNREGATDLESVMSVLAEAKNLYVEGFASHLAVADEHDEESIRFSRQQLEQFLTKVSPYKSPSHILHIANSAGTMIDDQSYHLDMVRPGLAIYGLADAPPGGTDDGLWPIAQLCARPTRIATLSPGDTVGYGRRFTARGGEKVATLALGYADGFTRSLGEGNTIVKLDGHRCETVGRVSMDQITILIPKEVDVSISESVFQVITADKDPVCSMRGRARTLGTIPYEIGTSLAHRIPRKYIEDDRSE